jgi:hypothetical protein
MTETFFLVKRRLSRRLGTGQYLSKSYTRSSIEASNPSDFSLGSKK